MAKIKINLSGGELTIDFSDTDDLEAQIQKIDFAKIDALLETKEQYLSDVKKPDEAEVQNIPKNVKDLGTINLLKVSEGGEDAVKLAVFLAASGMSREEIKKITRVTILSS